MNCHTGCRRPGQVNTKSSQDQYHRNMDYLCSCFCPLPKESLNIVVPLEASPEQDSIDVDEEIDFLMDQFFAILDQHDTLTMQRNLLIVLLLVATIVCALLVCSRKPNSNNNNNNVPKQETHKLPQADVDEMVLELQSLVLRGEATKDVDELISIAKRADQLTIKLWGSSDKLVHS